MAQNKSNKKVILINANLAGLFVGFIIGYLGSTLLTSSSLNSPTINLLSGIIFAVICFLLFQKGGKVATISKIISVIVCIILIFYIVAGAIVVGTALKDV